MRQITLDRYMTRADRQPGVREHTQTAVASSKSAYRRLNQAKSPAAALNDKKLRRDLRRASDSAGAAAGAAAAIALSTPQRMRTRDAVALGAILATLLIVVGVLFARSEKARANREGEQSDQVGEPESGEPESGESEGGEPAARPASGPNAVAESFGDPLR